MNEAKGLIAGLMLIIGLCLSHCGPNSLVNKTEAYMRGQIDAMDGKIHWQLVTNSNHEVIWKFK